MALGRLGADERPGLPPGAATFPPAAVSGLMDLAASISTGHAQMPVWSLRKPSLVGGRQRVAESLGLGARHIGILVPSVPFPGPVPTSEMLTPRTQSRHL